MCLKDGKSQWHVSCTGNQTIFELWMQEAARIFQDECFVQCQHALRMSPLLGGDNFDGRRSSLWHTSSWLGKIKAARENEDAPWQGVIP